MIDPMTGLQIATSVSGIMGGKKQKREARRASAAALAQRQEQQKRVDEQVAEYKAIKFENPYANLENVAEDMRVSTQAADFQAQQGAQRRADILGQLRGAAGTSGIAGLAQTLANQGALQAQKISAGLAKQELANEKARAQMAGSLQAKKAEGDVMVQQAETSRQSTILGMQMGQSQAANTAYQTQLLNQRKANLFGNQMMMSGVKNLANIDFSQFGIGDNPEFVDTFNRDTPATVLNENEMANQMQAGGDADGDGITELRKVCTVGSKILANEPIDKIPFVSLTPVKIPHKFFGLSVADLVMDLQLIKSTLMRNLMDNMYNQNFGRYAVLEGQANLDDLLTQRPGGVVRVKSPNAVTPLATPALEPHSFQMLEYIDSVRESRAGVSRMSQGLNDNALTSHTTATAVNAVMGAAHSRVELIARNFAETGVKDLMICIYELLYKNQDRERVVMLRNNWVPVRPDVWKDKYDCTVSVALGSGNKDQQMAHLSQMLSFAGEAMKGGLPIVNVQNMYNLGAALVKAMGFQNVDDFLTNPANIPPKPEEPSPEEQAKQMEMQLKEKELEIKAADVQVKMQKIQQEYQKDAVDAQLKAAELNLEAQQNRPVAIGNT